MQVPAEWLLGVIIGLGGAVATLAAIIRKQMSDEIQALRGIVTKLQDDVDRLSKGCGAASCHWRHR